MQTRKPVVAGQFYPAQRETCIREIKQCLAECSVGVSLPETIVGGIVPHAGWTFSGSLAALALSAVKQRHEKVDTFVIFGATHGYFGEPAVYAAGAWVTPLGEVAVDEELAEAVVSTGAAISDALAHGREHSIEVQVPFVQYLFEGAQILPVLVPPNHQAVELGTKVGELVRQQQRKRIVCLGSTDLTHYGPRYGFTPMGVGKEALEWASKVNDQRFIDLALKLEPEGLLASAAENGNACGPGAAAAVVALAKELGKSQGVLLAHTNSNEVMLRKMGRAGAESVGYAAIVF